MRIRSGISAFLLFIMPGFFLVSCGWSTWFGSANRPPVADAGPDMTVYQGQQIRLNGSGSFDPDRTILSYRWSQTDGKPVAGFDHDLMNPETIAPFVGPEGEDLKFLLTVTDTGGLSATDTVKITVKKYLFYDDFRFDTTGDYATRNIGNVTQAGKFLYVDPLKKVHVIPGYGGGLQLSHDVPACDYGTFSFVFSATRFGRLGGKIRVFLMENDTNYYELFNYSLDRSGGLRKVIDGRQVDGAELREGYAQNREYEVKIVFSPGSTIVDAFDQTVTMKKDRNKVLVRRFEIHTEEQETYFDNIVLTQDPFVKISIPNRVGLWDAKLPVRAISGNIRKGWKARFILDYQKSNQFVMDDVDEPFEAIFSKVSLSAHTVDAFIMDDSGTEALARDQVKYIATDGFYVAIGDSITRGTGDDGSPKKGSFLPNGVLRFGYIPVLEDLLTKAKGYPHTIVNHGVGGQTSAEALISMPSYLLTYPEANYYLILCGTNDSDFRVPSGKGLKPGDPGYQYSFKDNMQRIISMILEANKTPILAKIPIVWEKDNTKDRFSKPDSFSRNVLIREYNQVIEELISSNGIPIPPPDFYTYFRAHPKEYSDNVHPNGTGYRSMAELWLRVLVK